MLRIELIEDARAELGEGPLWDVAEQRLYNAAGGERRT